jgi:hypothetical protein
VSGDARVVQVHVGQAQVAKLGEGDAVRREPRHQRVERGRRTRVDEHGLALAGSAQQRRADRALEAPVLEVDDVELGRQPRSSSGTNRRSPSPT